MTNFPIPNLKNAVPANTPGFWYVTIETPRGTFSAYVDATGEAR